VAVAGSLSRCRPADIRRTGWLQRKCGTTISGAKEFIEAAIVAEEMAAELQIAKGGAVLIVRRRSHAQDGSPVEYAVLHFRADRYRLQLETGAAAP
jgi:GntR family transcriptional regulator